MSQESTKSPRHGNYVLLPPQSHQQATFSSEKSEPTNRAARTFPRDTRQHLRTRAHERPDSVSARVLLACGKIQPVENFRRHHGAWATELNPGMSTTSGYGLTRTERTLGSSRRCSRDNRIRKVLPAQYHCAVTTIMPGPSQG